MEDNDIGKVIVVCRFRPLNEKEQSQSKSLCVEFSEDNKSVNVNSQYENGEDLNFTFDHVFSPSGTQQEVYEIAAKPIIEAVFQGFNGTVLTYGQTSSGKTYTMTGYNNNDLGIIPRLISDLFNIIGSSSKTIEYTIKISYCEIYLEKIKDLIEPTNNNLKIQEDKIRGVHIPELTETCVINDKEVLELIKIGTSNREISYTNMNATSSRSHSIFIISVTQNDTKDCSAKSSKLYLVDLAGSEKVGKTGAAGKRLEEAKNINKSLTTLGQVITSLTDSKSTHIPYRDSKLTRVLQDSLGGNAKTTLILTCSPSPWNESETISTLRFGIRAKAIKNKPKINKEYTVNELKIMLYAAKEEIKKKDKVIESFRGLDLNESKDYEQSFSVISFSNNEFIENMQELDRLKNNLSNEIRKNLDLSIENNEKQALLDEEIQKNQKISSELDTQSIYITQLEHQILAKDENIKTITTETIKLGNDLESTLINFEYLRQENELYIIELKSLQQQILDLKNTELQNCKLRSSLEYEMGVSKKLAEEICALSGKLEEYVVNAPNLEQIIESVKESVETKERAKWEYEKKIILADFEEHLKRFSLANEQARAFKQSFLDLKASVDHSQKVYMDKIQALQLNNLNLRREYEEIKLKYKQVCLDYQLQQQNRTEIDKKSLELEKKIQISFSKADQLEKTFTHIPNQTKLSPNAKKLLQTKPLSPRDLTPLTISPQKPGKIPIFFSDKENVI
jgi:kinesin family member 5